MLVENDVVDAVMSALTSAGWVITAHAYSHQHGDDVVAERDGAILRVEAKGAGTAKFDIDPAGHHFTNAQVRSHVAVAVLRAMSWMGGETNAERAALALPDNTAHRNQVAKISPALRTLGIGVFWVSDDGVATLEAGWAL